MSKELKKLILWILAYAIIVIPIIWIWLGMAGIMGHLGDVLVRIEEENSLLRAVLWPFEILFAIGFWGGLGLAILSLLIGCFNVTKKWGKNICLFGIWIAIFYLIGATGTYTISFLADPFRSWSWFLLETLLISLISWVFTILIFVRIRKI